MRGKLEALREGAFVGWVWNPDEPSARIRFELRSNGRSVFVGLADRPRGDLARASIGDGHHAFQVPADPGWLGAAENRITLHAPPGALSLGQVLIEKRRAPPADLAEVARRYWLPESRVAALVAEVEGLEHPAVPEPPAVIFARSRGVELPGTLDAGTLTALVSSLLAGQRWDEASISAALEPLVRSRAWAAVALACGNLPTDFPPSARLLGWYGRALFGLARYQEAAEVLTRLQTMAPLRHGDLVYLGLAFGRLGRWREALAVLRNCLAQAPSRTRYQHEVARALIQVGFGGYGVDRPEPVLLESAKVLLRQAFAAPDAEWRVGHDLASLLVHRGDLTAAREVLAANAERAPMVAGVFADLARLELRAGDLPRALRAAERALALDPRGDSTRFNLRLLRSLSELDTAEPSPSLAHVADWSTASARVILDQDATWIVLDGLPALDGVRWVSARGFPWAAGIRRTQSEAPLVWRRAFLTALLDAGLVAARESLATLLSLAARLGRFATVEPQPWASTTSPKAGKVLLLSRHGGHRFGGGEHFLAQMAALYRAKGFSVVIAGAEGRDEPPTEAADGMQFATVSADPGRLLRFVVEQGIDLVHVISGMALEAVTALSWLDVRIVHGVHFWRDLLQPPTPSPGYYPDVDGSTPPRLEFAAVVRDAGMIYANSVFTQDVIERHFGVRAPVLESRPDDVAGAPAVLEPEGRTEVLLVNARAEKGFDLILELARRLPAIWFRVIASQSSRALAEAAAAGLANVIVQGPATDMAPVYRRARLVCVPSYRFVETFSRVTLEAQRFGVPVIGSDRGNVPNLLAESGTVLPDDPDVWAHEIAELFASDELWRERAGRAYKASARRPFSEQAGRLGRIISGLEAPMLVGIGSGLGNVLHTTPLLRFLAEKLGRTVDVLIAGDHPEMLFIPSNPDYVTQVFSTCATFSGRRYDTVLLTQSFGEIIPRFAAERVLRTRDVERFEAGHALHEAEFNISTVCQLLGLSYVPGDAQRYFVGTHVYRPPHELLVGLHAGSKGGIWAAKRWPHYESLARMLKRRGIAVASFGTADEYVEGTLDLTGGTIEEMTRRMLACSHFVANDSGVMNIANALGIPLVAIFAPTNRLTRGPLHPNATIVSLDAVCAPCEITTPYVTSHFRSGECRCIGDIPVHEVLAALDIK